MPLGDSLSSSEPRTRAICRSHMPGTKISAQRHRSVLIPLKILFWRLCDYRRSYRGALSPIFQPCGQGSFLEAVLQQMPRLAAGTHFLSTRTDDTMPLADSLNITNTHTPRNPRGTQFVTFFLQRLSHSPDTRTDALRTRINTDDLHHVISRDFNTESDLPACIAPKNLPRAASATIASPSAPHVSHRVCTYCDSAVCDWPGSAASADGPKAACRWQFSGGCQSQG